MMAAKNSEKFEDALERLETIVRELEEGSLSLEDALAKYEEGVKTLKNCYETLRKAEKKIEIVVKDEDGTLRVEPFEPESEEGQA
jgi:exodeoxyribonuclease VII small subunit